MEIDINDKFKPLFENDTRYFLLTGGRGSAKSFSTSLDLCISTFEPNQKILFTRYTMVSAAVSIIPEFLEKIELLNAQHCFDVTKDSITNKLTGSSIIFKGIKTSSGNQTASLKSLQGITTWVLDEAEELVDESIFDKIDLSIRTKGLQNKVILILNPTTKEHWIYQKFFEQQGLKGGFNGVKGQTTYIHTTYLDNLKNLDESFLINVDNIKENRPEKYQHQILGGWLDKAEGVIYNNWDVGEFDNTLPYLFGQDYGFSPDPTVLIKIAIDEKKKLIYCKEYLYNTNLNTEGIERANKEALEKETDLIVGDNAEPRLINDLQSRGINIIACTKGKDSIVNGIALVRDYKLIIDNSPNLIKELNNYCWNNKKASIPIDNYNHLLDAMRYAVTYQLRQQDFFVV